MAAKKKATAATSTTTKASGPILLADKKTEAKPAALRAALQVYGEEAAEDATTEQLLEKVHAHVEKSLKGHRCTKKCDTEGSTCPKLRCAVCKEVGTEETSFCPFCGDEGEGTAGGEATPAAPPPAPAAEEVTAPPAPAEEAPASAEEPAGEDEAPPAPEGEEGGEELATTEGAAPMEQMKERLASAKAQIDQHLKNIDATGFDMGLVLRQIHEDELWKAEEGCRNFTEYVESNFPLRKSTAYELMTITKKFDKETFLKVGRSKLYLIAKEEDPQKQEEQLRAALGGNGPTVEALKVERRGGAPEPVSEEPKRGAPAAEREPSNRSPAPEREPPAAPKSAPKGERSITLLAKVGSKAQQAQWRNGDTGRVLAHFRDGAYSEIPISEEVTLHITPKVDTKALKADVLNMLVSKQGMTEKQAQAVVDAVLEKITGVSYRFMEAV